MSEGSREGSNNPNVNGSKKELIDLRIVKLTVGSVEGNQLEEQKIHA